MATKGIRERAKPCEVFERRLTVKEKLLRARLHSRKKARVRCRRKYFTQFLLKSFVALYLLRIVRYFGWFAMKKALSPSQEQVLHAISLGTTSLSVIAGSIDLPKKEVEQALSVLVERGFVSSKGVLGKKHLLTAEGVNALGAPKLELDIVREATVLKSGEHSKLTITVSNVGSSPAAGGFIRIISPKVLRVARFGCNYKVDPEHNVLEYGLAQLNPGEVQTAIFDLRATLPSGILSSKYKLSIQCYSGETVAGKAEVSLHVENPLAREETE